MFLCITSPQNNANGKWSSYSKLESGYVLGLFFPSTHNGCRNIRFGHDNSTLNMIIMFINPQQFARKPASWQSTWQKIQYCWVMGCISDLSDMFKWLQYFHSTNKSWYFAGFFFSLLSNKTRILFFWFSHRYNMKSKSMLWCLMANWKLAWIGYLFMVMVGQHNH